jgi:hypothetical protein
LIGQRLCHNHSMLIAEFTRLLPPGHVACWSDQLDSSRECRTPEKEPVSFG